MALTGVVRIVGRHLLGEFDDLVQLGSHDTWQRSSRFERRFLAGPGFELDDAKTDARIVFGDPSTQPAYGPFRVGL
jgi:hypothetical protein